VRVWPHWLRGVKAMSRQ